MAEDEEHQLRVRRLYGPVQHFEGCGTGAAPIRSQAQQVGHEREAPGRAGQHQGPSALVVAEAPGEPPLRVLPPFLGPPPRGLRRQQTVDHFGESPVGARVQQRVASSEVTGVQGRPVRQHELNDRHCGWALGGEHQQGGPAPEFPGRQPRVAL